MKNKKDGLIIAGLIILTLILLYAIVPAGHLFGSETDWLSQHITISDDIRQQFYQTHDLFPDYMRQIGGGQNIYFLSYYGLFRPDVLISLCLPFVAMKDIIISGMIISCLLSVSICYIWLRGHHCSRLAAASSSFLLISSGPIFFHAHRQIMFVNYMPWLLLGLLAIDRIHYKNKGKQLLIICVILMILNSYFYSVSAILVLFIYDLILRFTQDQAFEWRSWLSFCLMILIGILICGILLFPTLAAMLESQRSGTYTSLLPLLIPDSTLKGLFYQAYGAGVTAAVWVMLVPGWLHSNQTMRWLSRLLTITFLFPIIPFLMNGMLYARAKILIVFLPLIVLYIALYLNSLNQRPLKLWHVPFILLPAIASLLAKEKTYYLAADMIISLLVLWMMQQSQKQQGILVINLVAAFSCIQLNHTENFVTDKKYETIYDTKKAKLIGSYLDGHSRFEDFTNSMNTSNLIQHENMLKPSSYSSLKNADYNTFFYDVLKNPISIRNRTAHVSSNNVFMQGMMGCRYVFTKKILPAGYTEIARIKAGILAENPDVMPLAYATSELMSQSQFQQIPYPMNLDTIYNQAVVPMNGIKNSYTSKIKPVEALFQLTSGKHVTITPNADGYLIDAKKDTKITVPMIPQTNQQVLFIQFDVEAVKVSPSRNISITINDIKNTLSSVKAMYPNENHTFHYTLSSSEPYHKAVIHFSKGTYRISHMQFHSMDLQAIEQRRSQVDEVKLSALEGKEVLKGNVSVSKDGYLITSLPYQKGYKILVDGKSIAPVKVNTAFVGFPIQTGDHNIVISFHAPGKTLGWAATGTGIVLWMITSYIRRKQHA